MGKSARNANSVNRLDALTVATVAEAKALDVPVGTVVETQGELTASDGGSKKYVVVASGSGSNEVLFPTMNNGNQLRLIAGNLISDLTVNIPTDYQSIQSAFDGLNNLLINYGATVSIMVETGHILSEGLNLEGGDYSQFRISSQDLNVVVNNPTDVRFFRFTNCNAPLIEITLDGNNEVEEMYRYTSSRGQISPGFGAKNTYGRILYVSNTMLRAGGTAWDSYEEIFCTQGSGVNLGSAIMENATTAAVVFAEGATGAAVSADISNCALGLHAKDGAVVDAEFMTTDNCSDEAVRVDNAVVTLDRAELINCQQEAINILNGIVNAPNITMTSDGVTSNSPAVQIASGSLRINSSSANGFVNGISQIGCCSLEAPAITVTSRTQGVGNGVLSRYGGKANLIGAIIKGFDNDIRVLNGGQVIAFSVETTNSQTSGNFPDVGDTEAGGSGGFNVILTGAKGIIWA